MMRQNRRLTEATEELRERLDIWRKSHGSPSPYPIELWDRAVELATQQGLYKTARALHLDYGTLKKRATSRTSERPVPAEPQFVELLAPLSVQIAECCLEVESPRGARLRIEMRNVAASGLVPIIREFAG
jgi:hypothetical protein